MYFRSQKEKVDMSKLSSSCGSFLTAAVWKEASKA